MRILTRYVVFDLMKVFCLTLTGLTVLIFVVLIGKEAVDKGIGLIPLLRMTPYLLPQAMQFAVPGTMLLAATSVYGRMSGFNEIVAVKSLGISPMVLVWPTLLLSVVVSLAAVALNDLAVSWGHLGVQRVFVESLEEVVYSQLRMHHSYNSGTLNITVPEVRGRTLVRPTLIVQGSAGHPPLTVSAEEAELRSFPDEGRLVLRFHNFEMTGPVTITNPDTYEHEMSLTEVSGEASGARSPSNYALAEISPALSEQRERIANIEDSHAATIGFAILTGQFDELSDESWRTQERALSTAQNRLHRLKTEPWRRWANGFSCLCFVMIGVPMAIRLRHSDFLASFFACFLPILIVYYPLLMVSVDQAKGGDLPPQAVWIGNIVLAMWGLWLMRRVIRY